MIARLLLLLPLALAACASEMSTPARAPDASGFSLTSWIPDLPPRDAPILQEDLPPLGTTDLPPTSAPSAPDNALYPLPKVVETLPDLALAPSQDRAEATWTPIAILPGIPERRFATIAARTALGADCPGHIAPAALPFATPLVALDRGQIAVAAEEDSAPMIYLRDPDGAWHCGLRRAEAPARAGRWQIYIGALLENAPITPAHIRIEAAAP